MNVGSTVVSQIMNFCQCTNSDGALTGIKATRVRAFTCYDQYLCMSFAQKSIMLSGMQKKRITDDSKNVRDFNFFFACQFYNQKYPDVNGVPILNDQIPNLPENNIYKEGPN